MRNVYSKAVLAGALAAIGVTFGSFAARGARDASTTLSIVDMHQVTSGPLPAFSRFEVTFDIAGSVATNTLWPYDANPPSGVPVGRGISVSATFTDPDGRQFVQPAFHAQDFDSDVRDTRDWHLPTGRYRWHVRFSPNQPGSWTYRIVATDRSGTATSPMFPLAVTPSTARGFVRVSQRDPRYFEHDNGALLNGLGFEFPEQFDTALSTSDEAYHRLEQSRVDFVRLTLASLFGSAWTSWIGGRHQYRGYLPVTGLVPFTDAATAETKLAMKLDYEVEGDTGWFDACRMGPADGTVAVEPRKLYRLRIRYQGSSIRGPRTANLPTFGLVAKFGGWHPDCYEPGSGSPMTPYGGDTIGWQHLEGTWFSGDNMFLPRLYLALDNVLSGSAYIESISLREDLGGGSLGPELLSQSSMAYHEYVDERKALAFDLILQSAERHDVYLKVVVGEKEDKVYLKMADDGTWVTSGDNADGYYGLGRRMNRTRWIQQAWWRYLQARWGYSPNIHSWELLNEGDPSSHTHYEMADEFGKFMHCRVFGVAVDPTDGANCPLDHPNAHMVTTSFWHSFPAAEFWNNDRYPNLDYADLHAYVSTSVAPFDEKNRMQSDAAAFHLWHSRFVANFRLHKPVVRGEAGLDSPDQQDERVAGIEQDTQGLWLHNYLWSTLDSGGLYELYWWRSHIWSEQVDFRQTYARFGAFLDRLPLNAGGYQDWDGSVTDSAIRVVGQKNLQTGRMHLWIQNRAHTWKNVSSGMAIPPVSTEIAAKGFEPGRRLQVEWYDPYSAVDTPTSVDAVVVDADGVLRLTVRQLASDVAVMVQPSLQPNVAQPAVKQGGVL